MDGRTAGKRMVDCVQRKGGRPLPMPLSVGLDLRSLTSVSTYPALASPLRRFCLLFVVALLFGVVVLFVILMFCCFVYLLLFCCWFVCFGLCVGLLFVAYCLLCFVVRLRFCCSFCLFVCWFSFTGLPGAGGKRGG